MELNKRKKVYIIACLGLACAVGLRTCSENKSISGVARNGTVELRTHLENEVALAGDRDAPKEKLIELSRRKDYKVQLAIAWNYSAPAEALDNIYELRSEAINPDFYKPVDLNFLVGNPNTSWKTLEKIAALEHDRYMSDEGLAVCRSNMAHRGDVTPEFLRRLSDDDSWKVRWSVALNERTPADILSKLTGDPNEVVSRDAKVTLAKLRTGK